MRPSGRILRSFAEQDYPGVLLHVKPAWTASCAARGSRSVIAFREFCAVQQDGANPYLNLKIFWAIW